MPPRAHLITQQAHRPVIVGDHNIRRAIVIDVAERSGAAYFSDLKRRPALTRRVAKPFAAPLVMKQLLALGIWKSAALLGAHDRDPAVSNEQIQPAVVIVVEPLRTEAGRAERRLQ